jgi:hypothetical protein
METKKLTISLLESGAGDGNRTNPNEPNKGVTTRFSIQLESNGVKSVFCPDDILSVRVIFLRRHSNAECEGLGLGARSAR